MSEDIIGREIGSYKIVDMIGRGGMGHVYRAQHPYIGKQVAIKLLKAEYSTQAEVVQRFFQEAKSVNNIHHENVIDVLDFGRTKEDEYFIIMELLEGRTLSQALQKEAPFPLKRTAHICLQICAALEAAHKNNILHRDLKSDNIFLISRAGQKDFVKVLDFGIAKLMNDPSAASNTSTGMVMGTPLYMAPEQALGKPLNAQTDVYALGVVLYQMATGTVPFFDPNPVALATMHVTAEAPKPSKFFPGINPELEKIILKCLEKEQSDRFLSMRETAEAVGLASKTDLSTYFGAPSSIDKAPKKEDAPNTEPTPQLAAAPQKTKSVMPWLIAGFVSAAMAGGVIWALGNNEEKLIIPEPKAPLTLAPVNKPETPLTSQPAATKPVEPAVDNPVKPTLVEKPTLPGTKVPKTPTKPTTKTPEQPPEKPIEKPPEKLPEKPTGKPGLLGDKPAPF
jgi:serine/threonine protein kinase